jgi:hypothetical protein
VRLRCGVLDCFLIPPETNGKIAPFARVVLIAPLFINQVIKQHLPRLEGITQRMGCANVTGKRSHVMVILTRVLPKGLKRKLSLLPRLVKGVCEHTLGAGKFEQV